MPEINSDQLESIQRLLLCPLRETVRTEIQLSHDQLASSIGRLDERLAGHIERSEKRVAALERESARLKAARNKVAGAYGVLAVVVSLVWSFVRDKLFGKL